MSKKGAQHQEQPQLETEYSLADRLKRLIELSGKNKSSIAQEIGIPPSYFTSWLLNGKYPTIENIIKICSYFNISSDYLIGIHPQQDLLDTLVFNQTILSPEMTLLPSIGNNNAKSIDRALKSIERNKNNRPSGK